MERYEVMEKRVAQARVKREIKDMIVNAIEFTACTVAVVTGLFFGWLTLGLMFR